MDTSVLVAGIRSSNGASRALLGLIAEGRVTPLASLALFLEYEDVLKRPEQLLAHGYAPDDVDGILAALASAMEPVEVHFRWRPQLRDPDDDMVLEVAIHGNAEALVTHNIADFGGVPERFGIPVLRPAEVLTRIRS